MNNAHSDRKVSIEFKGSTYSNSNVLSVSSLITGSDTYSVTIKYGTNKYIETILIN